MTITVEQWMPAAAEEAARRAGIEMGPRHWQAVASWREVAARESRKPTLADLAQCGFESAELQSLFRGEAASMLMRIAGAPEFQEEESS